MSFIDQWSAFLARLGFTSTAPSNGLTGVIASPAEHRTLSTSDPPVPPNYKRYVGTVSPEMANWARSVVDDPARFPYGAVDTRAFGDRLLAARVEHHTWTYRGGQKITGNFRGVTLYEVTG